MGPDVGKDPVKYMEHSKYMINFISCLCNTKMYFFQTLPLGTTKVNYYFSFYMTNPQLFKIYIYIMFP